LVGNFLQMVELHYRDGWPVARYADALGVTSDKLHAHCQREKNCGPRAIIHERLVREACTRLQQLDLPRRADRLRPRLPRSGLFQPLLPKVSRGVAGQLSPADQAGARAQRAVVCGVAVN